MDLFNNFSAVKQLIMMNRIQNKIVLCTFIMYI